MNTDETNDIKGNAPATENETTGREAAAEGAAHGNKADNPHEVREEINRLLGDIEGDEEQPLQNPVTLTKILGGEYLNATLLRKQIWLVALIMFFVIVYVSNRYRCDKQRIQIAALNKELEETKFKAMSSTSNLTRISRESNVLKILQQNKDSVLHTPSQPPYIINVPEE